MRHVCSTATIALLLVGCSPAAGDADIASEFAKPFPNTERTIAEACDILTVDLVEKALGVGSLPVDDASRTSNRAVGFTSCTLKWNSSKTREMVVGGRSITVRDENRITLSVSIFERGRSQFAYDAGVRRLKPRNVFADVAGVGEEATLFPDMSQISVRGRDNVFHLAVHYPDGDGDPLDEARDMARQVLEKLE